AKWSVTAANRGRYSQNRTPGMPVGMVPNGPPVGMPGLGSKVSIWLGPPLISTKITCRAGLRAVGIAAGVGGFAAALPARPLAATPQASDSARNRRREGLPPSRGPIASDPDRISMAVPPSSGAESLPPSYLDRPEHYKEIALSNARSEPEYQFLTKKYSF